MSRVGCMVAGGDVAAVLSGCASSAPASGTAPTRAVARSSATAPSASAGSLSAISPARSRPAAAGDVDGDGGTRFVIVSEGPGS